MVTMLCFIVYTEAENDIYTSHFSNYRTLLNACKYFILIGYLLSSPDGKLIYTLMMTSFLFSFFLRLST